MTNLVFSRLKNPENRRAKVPDDYSSSHDVQTDNKSVVTSIRKIAHTSHSVAFSDETSLSAEKGVTGICSAFFNFSSPKVPPKWGFFYYLEVSGVSLIISRRVRPVLIPTTYLNFSDDPAFLKLSRCSGRPF